MKNPLSSTRIFVGEIVGELQKATWPTWPELRASTVVVILAAVILGGTPFPGGRGTVVGVAPGAVLIGVINDVIVLLGLPSLYESIFVAIVLVVAGLQGRGNVLTQWAPRW